MRAQFQTLRTGKPTKAECFGNTAKGWDCATQQEGTATAEKGLRRKDRAAALDVRPPGGWIEKDGYATEPEERDEDQVQFRRHRVQQQNTVARLEAGSSHLIGHAGCGGI